jgi:hypothetical protein
MKSYATKDSAKRALRKAGLQLMPVVFETERNGVGRERIVPVVQCELTEDVREVRNRGFKAVKVAVNDD